MGVFIPQILEIINMKVLRFLQSQYVRKRVASAIEKICTGLLDFIVLQMVVENGPVDPLDPEPDANNYLTYCIG